MFSLCAQEELIGQRWRIPWRIGYFFPKRQGWISSSAQVWQGWKPQASYWGLGGGQDVSCRHYVPGQFYWQMFEVTDYSKMGQQTIARAEGRSGTLYLLGASSYKTQDFKLSTESHFLTLWLMLPFLVGLVLDPRFYSSIMWQGNKLHFLKLYIIVFRILYILRKASINIQILILKM